MPVIEYEPSAPVVVDLPAMLTAAPASGEVPDMTVPASEPGLATSATSLVVVRSESTLTLRDWSPK